MKMLKAVVLSILFGWMFVFVMFCAVTFFNVKGTDGLTAATAVMFIVGVLIGAGLSTID